MRRAKTCRDAYIELVLKKGYLVIMLFVILYFTLNQDKTVNNDKINKII